MATDPRRDAQHRANQIRAFREELNALRSEGVAALSAEQDADVTAHHDRVLARLAREFDIDRSDRAGQLSRGLRLASAFGGVTLIAAIAALVQRYWGGLTLPAQVTLLTAFPLVALAGVQVAAERERTRYIASLFALTACGTAWVAIVMTARVLDIPFSALLLWPGACFGLALALSYGFRLVFAASLAALVVAVASVFFASGSVPWPVVFERLEPLTASAFVLVVVARHVGLAGDGFEDVTRQTGLLMGLIGLLALSSARGVSLLAFAPLTAMSMYQVVMLITCLALLWRRLHAGDHASVTLVSAALALFLLFRYIDWFWDVLPEWAFFLVLALGAFAAIGVLRRLRRRMEAA